MFSLFCAWTSNWGNNGDAGDLRRQCAHYDVTVMEEDILTSDISIDINWLTIHKIPLWICCAMIEMRNVDYDYISRILNTGSWDSWNYKFVKLNTLRPGEAYIRRRTDWVTIGSCVVFLYSTPNHVSTAEVLPIGRLQTNFIEICRIHDLTFFISQENACGNVDRKILTLSV